MKRCSDWKHSLGQLLAYNSEYPEKKMIMALFEIDRDIEKIIEFVKKFDIGVVNCDEKYNNIINHCKILV